MKQLVKFFQVLILGILWSGAQALAPYCTPTYSTGCTFGDGLIHFQLGTINQSIPCSGSPYPWYHDYTTLSTTLQTGILTPLTIMAGFSGTNMSVWIDFNNDNTFDASDMVVNGFICSSSNTNYMTNITIPNGTPLGNHRLRYRTEWTVAPSGPCTTQTYGNSCDFTVTITQGGLPGDLTITGDISTNTCFNATQTITVAGNGTTFIVQSGGSVTMIAGQEISYLPGTIVNPGGYMWGYINPSGPYCQASSMPEVTETKDEIPGSIEQSSFKIYPNPTTGNFILELKGEIPADRVTVDVYGMCGEKVSTEEQNGDLKHEFSLSNRPAGVYFIRVISGNKSETAKIIKQ